MSKIDEFKKFVSIHPEFAYEIENGRTTWQKLYELYDMYGEKSSIWNGFLKENNSFDLKSLFNTLKNINLDSLEENISSIQKAVGIVEEFTKPTKEETIIPKEENVDTLFGESNDK